MTHALEAAVQRLIAARDDDAAALRHACDAVLAAAADDFPDAFCDDAALPAVSRQLGAALALGQARADDALATAAAHVIAEMAKVDAHRVPLGDRGHVAPLVAAMGHAVTRAAGAAGRVDGAVTALVTQCLRAIGNLCYNEDANRERAAQCPALGAVVVGLMTTPALAALRPLVLTAVFNVCLEHDGVQSLVVDAGLVPVLGAIFDASREQAVRASLAAAASAAATAVAAEVPDVALASNAARVLSALTEQKEKGRPAFDRDALGPMLRCMDAWYPYLQTAGRTYAQYSAVLDLLAAMMNVFETIGEDGHVSESHRRILQPEHLAPFIRLLAHPPSHGFGQPPAVVDAPTSTRAQRPSDEETDDDAEDEDEASLTEALLQLQEVAIGVLTIASMSEQSMEHMGTNAELMALLSEWLGIRNERPATPNACTARRVMSPARVAQLVYAAPDRAEQYRTELVTFAALTVGNLARSDASCARVHGLQLGDDLCALARDCLAHFAQHGVGLPTRHLVKVVHAALGALKNLTLYVGSRADLAKIGLIPVVTAFLALHDLKPVQFIGIGILKNLVAVTPLPVKEERLDAPLYEVLTGEPMHAAQKSLSLAAAALDLARTPAAAAETPFTRAMAFCAANSGDNATPVRNETARLVVHLVRQCARYDAAPLMHAIVRGGGVPVMLQALTGARYATSADAADADAGSRDRPGKTYQTFPIVQNETLVGATILASCCVPAVPLCAAYGATLWPTLAAILTGVHVPYQPEDEEDDDDAAGDGAKAKHDSASQSEAAQGTPSTPADQSYPDQMRANACQFLCVLVEADPSLRPRVSEALKPTLERVLATCSDSASAPATGSMQLGTTPPTTPLALRDVVQRLLSLLMA
ncbi:hypothetical protein CXG81DRAFT_16559 [Caulochytrium protostelioides]|uniref:ARM repeat-containing protein n=1 Tax=Caulochytrium protostelioides TaxID=1555241 RepID=A0A4P9XFP9_9FUNG|nr:hypothetical protein CXG81DRAFT_16559 [Caulochytrium protostelioides]|eukprot:RKP03990.1 hypothetical protein CXG81DRAFT_16559 [Caulochytrium protostelioides]